MRLRPRLQGPVYGPARERIPSPSSRWRRRHHRGAGPALAVIDVPGHTAGHIAYLQQDAGDAPLLFCGDTLFSAGCGRLFEGTPAQMAPRWRAWRRCRRHAGVLHARIHLSNLRFAPRWSRTMAMCPRTSALHRAARGWQPTLPSTLALERRSTPFLRCTEPAVVAARGARRRRRRAGQRAWPPCANGRTASDEVPMTLAALACGLLTLLLGAWPPRRYRPLSPRPPERPAHPAVIAPGASAPGSSPPCSRRGPSRVEPHRHQPGRGRQHQRRGARAARNRRRCRSHQPAAAASAAAAAPLQQPLQPRARRSRPLSTPSAATSGTACERLCHARPRRRAGARGSSHYAPAPTTCSA
jgi:hypothetical protein